MSTVFAAAVDLGALWEVVWVGFLAGVGITTVFSLGVAGTIRAGEERRRGNAGAAGLLLIGGLIGFLAFTGLVVFAVHELVSR